MRKQPVSWSVRRSFLSDIPATEALFSVLAEHIRRCLSSHG